MTPTSHFDAIDAFYSMRCIGIAVEVVGGTHELESRAEKSVMIGPLRLQPSEGPMKALGRPQWTLTGAREGRVGRPSQEPSLLHEGLQTFTHPSHIWANPPYPSHIRYAP